MTKPTSALASALLLAGCAYSTAGADGQPGKPGLNAAQVADDKQTTNPNFVGRYNGNSFETAMGMIIREDGTWQWGLSVGALDLRGEGTWQQKGDIIHLTSDPKPVPPEFHFLSVDDRPPAKEDNAEDDKLVYVTRPDGKPFTYAEARIECANGARITEFVAGSNAYLSGYEPPECDRMIAVTVEQGIHNVRSPRIDLQEAGWKPGQILRFEFVPNDIGVADLTGMTGALTEGVLRFSGGNGINGSRPPRPGEVVLELRKDQPRTDQ